MENTNPYNEDPKRTFPSSGDSLNYDITSSE